MEIHISDTQIQFHRNRHRVHNANELTQVLVVPPIHPHCEYQRQVHYSAKVCIAIEKLHSVSFYSRQVQRQIKKRIVMKGGPSVLWFRHGLRLHDNPALLNALQLAKAKGGQFMAVFIFDGESAGGSRLTIEIQSF